ncbi:MAG: SDR family oxidoreductase [Rhodothermales bacterium]
MEPANLSEKIIMVTGANSGIGKEAALQLAERGARVVMVCRNRERGEPALAEIKAQSGNDTVELMTADFESQRQIRELADTYQRTHDRLDVLVNNAGLYLSKRHETEDGIEATWAVNHLAPFLLTNLLLEVIKASAPARIVTVASDAHRAGTLDFDDLEMKEKYRWIAAYAQSKLANVVFTYELARRLAGTGVTATCMHPGTVATGIWNRNKNVLNALLRLFKPFYMNPKKSAEAVVRLAVAPDVEGVTGKYFDRMNEASSSADSHDEEIAARLWQVSDERVGLAG